MDIPEDIAATARSIARRREWVHEAIAEAIAGERKRCAAVARTEAARYDTPLGSQPAYLAAYMIAEAIESGQ